MNESYKGIDWLSIIALCMAMLVWASSFIALKSSIPYLTPMGVIFGRMFIASLCFVYFIKDFKKLSLNKADIKFIIIMVLFEPCLYFVFEASALKYTSASNAGMITSLMPLMVAVVAGVFLGETIKKRVMLGAILAIVGAIWLSVNSDISSTSTNPILGNFLEFLAMICAAGYSVSVRNLSSKFSALFLTAIQAFAGAIFFFPFFTWELYSGNIIFDLSATLWMLYLGVVVTLGGYGFFNFALSRMEAHKASIYINLIPVFTVLLAYLILNEKMTFSQIVASVIILIGVVISQYPSNKKAKEPI